MTGNGTVNKLLTVIHFSPYTDFHVGFRVSVYHFNCKEIMHLTLFKVNRLFYTITRLFRYGIIFQTKNKRPTRRFAENPVMTCTIRRGGLQVSYESNTMKCIRRQRVMYCLVVRHSSCILNHQ